MIFCIVVSKNDPAGQNMMNFLLREGDFVRQGEFWRNSNSFIACVDDALMFKDNETGLACDMFIFATKHESRAGVKSLCVHAPGNWGPATHGGLPRKLCTAPAQYMKAAIKILQEKAQNTGFEVTREQTHHGPYVGKPAMFIEIGSSMAEWNSPVAAGIAAQTILELTRQNPGHDAAVVLGGGHYSHAANRTDLKSDYAAGHVCAKHCLAHLDEQMLMQAVCSTTGRVKCIILDWKGLGTEKGRVIELAEKTGLRVLRSSDL